MRLKLLTTKDVINNVRSFIFEPEEAFDWQAGQYMHYVFPLTNPDDKGVERWFTISAAPFEGHIMITTRLDNLPVSTFKQYLVNLTPGDEIEADGPKGKFIVSDPTKQYIFIAGGIGITPFRSILLQLAHDKQPINVDLLYAGRDDKFIFDDELQQIADSNPNFRIHKFASPKRIEESDIKTVADKLNDPEYYVSGPEPMVAAFDKMLIGMNVAEEKIHNDDFPGYEAI